MPNAPQGKKAKPAEIVKKEGSSTAQSQQLYLFCSYARQDADIVQAFTRAFQALSDTFNRNISIFSDQAIGPGRKFDDEIREKLQQADFLLVFYTGALKPSHSYTGFELGYFMSRIDEQESDEPKRQIVSFFLGQPPAPTTEIQGIDISIAPDDLGLSREVYVATAAKRASTAQDALTQFFTQVAILAEKRKPFANGDDRTATVSRYNAIAEKIVPALRGDLHECLSSRVARTSVEQRFIRFELPKSDAPRANLTGVPDDARLTEEGRAFQLFGVHAPDDGISWEEFRQELGSRGERASPALYAIERALVTVVSSEQRDNDQIIKAPQDNNLYRVIVTEQMEYYSGRLIVHMWFIRFLSRDHYGDRNTSILLSFITVASKYRFLFLEEESPLSIEKFRVENTPANLQELVRRLLREIILIEEESHVFELDKADALIVIAGTDANFEQVREHMEAYAKTRAAMELAAGAIVRASPDAAEFKVARDQWIAALDAFLVSSGTINSVYTAKALANLGKYFTKA